MKKGLIYWILVLIGMSCASSPEVAKGVFPDNLVVKKTNRHQRVLGTNLFAVIPEGYKFVNPFRYSKSDNEFAILSKLPIPFNYNERKATLELGDPEAQTVSFRELNFNNYKALFRESIIVDKNQHFYVLNFGNEKFSYMYLTQSLLDNSESRHEMMEILKSVCEDTTAKFDPLETASFSFDSSITGFQIAKSNINDFRFTQNGKYESDNKIVSSIVVSEIGKNTYENRTKLMNQWSKTYLKSNQTTRKNNWIETKIGDLDALEFESQFSLNGINGKVYFVILSDEQQRTMKFTGIAFNETEYYIKKYKETVRTIKFK